VPGKTVQLSPALAKLTSVGVLMLMRKAMGMMFTGVSGCLVRGAGWGTGRGWWEVLEQ